MTPDRTDSMIPEPRNTIDTVEVHGTHVPTGEVTAVYRAVIGEWQDMPEARPRARCRVIGGDLTGADMRVVCLVDGTVLFDADAVEIDNYEGAGYEGIRAEGEARWARVDAAAGR